MITQVSYDVPQWVPGMKGERFSDHLGRLG